MRSQTAKKGEKKNASDNVIIHEKNNKELLFITKLMVHGAVIACQDKDSKTTIQSNWKVIPNLDISKNGVMEA